MNAVVESVRSLWVPLEGLNLLLPNVAIAEVINYQPLDMNQGGPEWLLGSLHWRDRELPVISIEAMFGFERPQGQKGSRISIVNTVKDSVSRPFYAIVTAGIPRSFNADADALGDSVSSSKSLPAMVADCVQIGSEEAFIPDLEKVQALIEQVC